MTMSRQENDTIYRQETTKHLKHRLYETATNNPDIAGVFSEIADNRVETWIEEVPTAEPEIIRCRDCKHHDGIRCFRWNSTIITNFDDFCSNAERKEGEEDE